MSIVEVARTEDHIVVLTVNRPERRNALSANALSALHRAFDDIAAEAALRAVVLTGAGAAFCSGADMKSTAADADDTDAAATGALVGQVSSTIARNLVMQELMASLFEKVHRLRQPVIAAVNGAAHGGGFALALACDVRIAARSASFGAVFIKRGVSACDMGTSYHLPRIVGAGRSAELLLTGRVFDVAEADRIGLVTEVVDDDAVVERALAKAREIATNSPMAVWMTKETMWQTVDAPSLRHALDLENRTQIMCTATGENAEAFAAFREGRQPVWTGL